MTSRILRKARESSSGGPPATRARAVRGSIDGRLIVVGVLALGLALAIVGAVWRIRGGRDVPVGANTVIPNPLERGPVLIVTLGRSEKFGPIPPDAIEFSDVVPPSRETAASVASLLTGRFPREHGLVDERAALRADVPTLVDVLRAAGFATAAFGVTKLDLAALGLARGFEIFQVTVRGDLASNTSMIESVCERAGEWLLSRRGAPSFALVVLDAFWGEIDRIELTAARSLVAHLAADDRMRSITTVVASIQGPDPSDVDSAALAIHVSHGVPERCIDRTVSLIDVAPTLLRLLDLPALPGARGAFLFDPRETTTRPLICANPIRSDGSDDDSVTLRIGSIACDWPPEVANRVQGQRDWTTNLFVGNPELRDELRRLLREQFGYEVEAATSCAHFVGRVGH